MSRFSAFLEGVAFRTSTPTFEVGQEIPAIVTGRNGNDAVIRIGDTVLRLPDSDLRIDDEAIVRITAFDADSFTGEAEFVEVVDVDTAD